MLFTADITIAFLNPSADRITVGQEHTFILEKPMSSQGPFSSCSGAFSYLQKEFF